MPVMKSYRSGLSGMYASCRLQARGSVLQGDAADGDLACVKLQDAYHRFQRGGLAGTVVADETVDLARRNVQAQVIHGLFLSIMSWSDG